MKTVPASPVDVKAVEPLEMVAALPAEIVAAELVEVNPEPCSIHAGIYPRRIHIEDCVNMVRPLELDP